MDRLSVNLSTLFSVRLIFFIFLIFQFDTCAPKLITKNCFENATCDCEISNGTKCTLSEGNGSTSCEIDSHLYDSLSLIIDCTDFSGHVDLICIIDSFPSLTEIELRRCDYADPNFFPIDSKPEWDITFDWARQVGGETAFFMRLNNATTAVNLSNTRQCGLRSFASIEKAPRRIPIMFLRLCKFLRYVHFINTSFSLLNGLDFTTLFISNSVIEVKVTNSYLSNVYRLFEIDVMTLIKKYAQTELLTWVKANVNKSGSTSHEKALWYERMTRLIEKFQGWGDDTTRLTLVTFVEILSSLHVENQSFIYLSYARSTLSVLDLQQNRLEIVPSALSGFTSLSKLNLAHNRISAISIDQNSYVLYTLSHTLKELDLSYNGIKSLYGSMFWSFKALRVLDLSHNVIESAKNDGAKETMLKLVELDLSYNNLDSRSMRNITMRNVERVDLSNNSLDELSKSLTSFFPKVKYLNMTRNLILTIQNNSIYNLSNLNVIDLSDNLFNHLPVDALRTSKRHALGSRVNLILSRVNRNSPLGNKYYICDCNSVFAAEHAEFFHQGPMDGGYIYPHIDVPPGTKCVEKMHGDDPKPISTKRSCLCHTRNSIRVINYTTVEVEIIGKCPEPCSCQYTNEMTKKGLKKLIINCTATGISSIDPFYFNATVVMLSRNAIKVLSRGVFPRSYASIESLYLDHCSISRIESGSFKNLVDLEYLNLGHNKLKSLLPDAFDGMANLRYLSLENNYFTSFYPAPYANLSSLYNLILSNDYAECDCTWEIPFLQWIETKNVDVSMYITPPKECNVTSAITDYVPNAPTSVPFHEARIQELCDKVKQAKEQASSIQQLWIAIGTSACVIIFVSLSFFSIVYRWRHKIRSHMDCYLQSGFPRAILSRYTGLQTHHNKEFDIGFLFHVNQTPEYYELIRYLRGTTRRHLRTICLGRHLPGSLSLDLVTKFATELHTCVILLTLDFLNDDQLAETFYSLITTSLRKQAHINIIYIYKDRSVLQSRDWFFLDIHLRHHCGLEFKEHFFWERFISALPPPIEATDPAEIPQYDGRHDLRILTENSSVMADVCFLCDSRQVDHQLRQLFDRYRTSISLCCVRDSKCFGNDIGKLQEIREPTLNTVFGLSTQIIVILTPEFLENSWTERVVKKCLLARLQQVTFVGSVILIVKPPEFRHIIRNERFSYFNDVIDHGNTRVVQWDGSDCNWSLIDKEILTLNCPFTLPPNTYALNTEEFERIAYHNCVKLQSDDSCYNIFEQHAAVWSNVQRNSPVDYGMTYETPEDSEDHIYGDVDPVVSSRGGDRYYRVYDDDVPLLSHE